MPENLHIYELQFLPEGSVIDVTFFSDRPSQSRTNVPCMVLKQYSDAFVRVAVPSKSGFSVAARNLYYRNLGVTWTATRRE